MILQPRPAAARVARQAPAVRRRLRAERLTAGLPLIVHADDFGETLEITRGICLGIEAGALTSTSILANMPGTPDGLQRAVGLSDRASFGVHLNFCEGRPLTTARSLVNANGHFHGKRTLFTKAVTGQLALADLEAEISAQIARVRDAGVRISHVDGHKHLHQLPVVSTAVANVLPRFGIHRVRITRLGSLARAARSASGLVRELLAMKASGKFRNSGLRSPVRILDLRPFVVGRTGLQHWVDRQGPVELCCHPGTAAADADKPGSHRRSAELDFLLSPEFRELLRANGVRLVSYWDV
jgi:chitin disaccharide deacetylase